MSGYEYTDANFGKEYILNGLSSMPGGFFIYRADWDKEEILYANQALLDIFECADNREFHEVTGGTFRGIVHPDDYQRVEAEIRYQINSSEDNFDKVDYRIITGSGRVVNIEDFGRYIEDPWEGPLFYVFVSEVKEPIVSHDLMNNGADIGAYSYENTPMEDALSHAIRAVSILNYENDFEIAMNTMLKELSNYIHADYFYVLGKEEGRDTFGTTFELNLNPADQVSKRIKHLDPDHAVRKDVYIHRENDYLFAVTSELKTRDPDMYRMLYDVNVQNILQVPIYDCGEKIGFLGVMNTDRRSVQLYRDMLSVVSYSIAARLTIEKLKKGVAAL